MTHFDEAGSIRVHTMDPKKVPHMAGSLSSRSRAHQEDTHFAFLATALFAGVPSPPRWITPEFSGAACVTRTRDPIITNDVLYRLS